MNQKSKIALAGVAAALIISGGTLAHGAMAASSTSTNPMTSIVEKIATKFNLKQADVQQVFDEQHTTMETNRLDQAVTKGKLTADQEKLILAKQAELQPKMDAIRTMTDKSARKTAMDALRTETEKWATDNKIDAKWLRPGGGPRGGHMMGHRGGPDRDGDDANAVIAPNTTAPAAQ